jgi:excisionase family DNA binding protein
MSDLVGTPAQVADALEVSEDTVRELKATGRLPYVMISRQRWVVPWAALNRWLEDEAARNSTDLRREEPPTVVVGGSGEA